MARVEIVTGRERRRRWSDAAMLDLLAEADESGLSLAEVARRHDLYPQQLYTWRRLLRERLDQRSDGEAGATAFLPVDLAAPESVAGLTKTSAPTTRRALRTIEVRLANGRVLTASEAIDAHRLQRQIRLMPENLLAVCQLHHSMGHHLAARSITPRKRKYGPTAPGANFALVYLDEPLLSVKWANAKR